MVFIFRMAPYFPELYPLIRGLSHYFSPTSSKLEPLQFKETSTLAVYQKQQVDDSLKKVVHHLKEPLELFPKIILHAEIFLTIELDGNIEQLHWELTIKEAQRSLHCVLDALGVLHQGLFQSKILLKYVQQILNADSKRFIEEVPKLKKLKENLVNLNKFLDCVLLRYSSFNCKLPSTLTDAIKRAAKEIRKVIKQLKPDTLKDLIPGTCKVTEEDILCSVLGLHDDSADRLRSLSKEMRQHKTDMYYLLCFMKERYECLDVETDLHDTEAVQRYLLNTEAVQRDLQKMGFTENRSNVIAKWIAKQPFPEHKSLLAWAQIYIEDLFNYDIFLNDEVSKFPYKESHLDGWFGVKVECGESDDGSVSEHPVPVINTNGEKSAVSHIEEKMNEFKSENQNGQLYFHGTDHKSAKNILENGINLDNGKLRCDFSHGRGFYVADKFRYALEYAQKSKAAAVIMFNISGDCLERGLDLSGLNRRKVWKSVTDYFHSGAPKRNHKLDPKLYNEIKSCNYIFGPVSRDGRDGIKSRKCENVLQICIRDEEMSDEIGSLSRIAGIIFLNVEDTQLARR